MSATFGPGGNSEAFAAAGKKSTLDAPQWIKEIGLDSYEYEAVRGVNASAETLSAIGEKAKENGIKMSVHAPYFISLSGIEEEKRLNSIRYIRDSVDAAVLLGAKKIVCHPGGLNKLSREEATNLAKETLYKVLSDVEHPEVMIGIETMGKINQLGNLEEVLEMCSIDSRLCPIVDWGHLNARNVGNLFVTVDDYRRIFDLIANKLGDEYANDLHCHFSKIEFTDKGEKKHLTFADTVFGPPFEPLMEAIVKEGVNPNIICESAGTQSDDALTMKKYYEAIAK